MAFAIGKFAVTHAAESLWDEGLRKYFAYRDLGMVAPTGGALRAHVIRPNGPCPGPGDLHYHKLDFQMVYVLKGWARVWFEGVGEVRFEEGSCMIEITSPADFETVTVAP